MNKLSITYLIIISLLFNYRGPVKEENKNNTAASSLSLHVGDKKYFKIDRKESEIIWKGSMQIRTNSHFGYVYISKGELMIENGKLMGGSVEIDMNTIEGDDHRGDSGLIMHLKDPDFFDVKKFPTAIILLNEAASTNSKDIKVTGNLTIKGITNAVTFPAKIKVKNGIVNMNGKLVIDRTK